jgi:hypothetical protein
MRGRSADGRPPALSLGNNSRPPPLALGGKGKGRGLAAGRPSLTVTTARAAGRPPAARPSGLTVGVPSIQGRGGRPAPLRPTPLGLEPAKIVKSVQYRERSEGGRDTAAPKVSVYKRKSGTAIARRNSHRGGSGPVRPMRPNADQMLAIRAEKLGYSQNFL